MSNLNKIYHKGDYRSGEWSKHLRPYLKRVGNKKWRKTGKCLTEYEEIVNFRKSYIGKKIIKVRITKLYYGNIKIKTISKYRKMRDAENAMNQQHVIKAEILEN